MKKTQLNTMSKTMKATVIKYHNAIHSIANEVALKTEELNNWKRIIATDEKQIARIESEPTTPTTKTAQQYREEIKHAQDEIVKIQSALHDYKEKFEKDVNNMKELFTSRISRKEYENSTTEILKRVYVDIFAKGGVELGDDIINELEKIATKQVSKRGSKVVESGYIMHRAPYITWINDSCNKIVDLLQEKDLLQVHKYTFIPKSLR